MIDFKNIAKLNQELAKKYQAPSEESPKARGEACETGKEERKECATIVINLKDKGGAILNTTSEAGLIALVLVECSNMLLEAGEKELLKEALETAKLGL